MIFFANGVWLKTLAFVMTCAFAGAGYYFSTKPTSAISENQVPKVPGSEPWNTGTEGKYQYHPGGDTNAARRDAPSALNTVIIPNVTLPKVYCTAIVIDVNWTDPGLGATRQIQQVGQR